MISGRAFSRRAGATRWRPRCTATSAIGWPLTVAATAFVGAADEARAVGGAGGGSWGKAVPGSDSAAAASTAQDFRNISFLLIPDDGSHGPGRTPANARTIATVPRGAQTNLRGGGVVRWCVPVGDFREHDLTTSPPHHLDALRYNVVSTSF